MHVRTQHVRTQHVRIHMERQERVCRGLLSVRASVRSACQRGGMSSKSTRAAAVRLRPGWHQNSTKSAISPPVSDSASVCVATATVALGVVDEAEAGHNAAVSWVVLSGGGAAGGNASEGGSAAARGGLPRRLLRDDLCTRVCADVTSRVSCCSGGPPETGGASGAAERDRPRRCIQGLAASQVAPPQSCAEAPVWSM